MSTTGTRALSRAYTSTTPDDFAEDLSDVPDPFWARDDNDALGRAESDDEHDFAEIAERLGLPPNSFVVAVDEPSLHRVEIHVLHADGRREVAAGYDVACAVEAYDRRHDA